MEKNIFTIPEGLSPEMVAMVEKVLKIRFPEVQEKPEVGKWYRISPSGCVTSRGTPWHAEYKQGTKNNLIIQFGGGGVSWSEYMAARPSSLIQGEEPQFYFPDTAWVADAQVNQGICLEREDNPFKDWSVLVLPYSSGDFHCGTSDFSYTALDGTKKILHHHGYSNFHAVMRKVMQFVPQPVKILVCGESAGGFGTALMTDEVTRLYPDCKDVTCCVDSSLILKKDWNAATEVWGTPKRIVERIHSDNITFDLLKALWQEHGEQVKILFICSIRDMLLVNMQNYVDVGNMNGDKTAADNFQMNLTKMCAQLQEEIPTCGLYIFDTPMQGAPEECHFTMHTILMDNALYDLKIDNVPLLVWLWQAVNGDVKRLGLDLLVNRKC